MSHELKARPIPNVISPLVAEMRNRALFHRFRDNPPNDVPLENDAEYFDEEDTLEQQAARILRDSLAIASWIRPSASKPTAMR